MTESLIDTASLDTRRRRLIFRAWHRGIREMDLILGRYVDTHIQMLNVTELDELEYIMSFEDRDLLAWLMGEDTPPHDINTPIFHALLATHQPSYL
ncbi:succinate dehydrogenase assembly factor 2 [Bartonella sp. DGB2]|uniref:FAD assembly factor SdhE n=1 Tax=Bartonella sp. DGB2 TaxID=3388426 RepID=UPI00398FF3CB